MQGKLIENVKYQQIFTPLAISASTVLYNGVAATTVGYIDTRNYDDCNIVLNMGVAAAGAVIDAAVYESDDVDPSASTALADADFVQIVPAADEAIQTMSILTKNTKRYLWLQTSKTDVGGASAVLSAVAVLGKSDSGPQVQVPAAVDIM